MHLLAAQPGALSDNDEAIDLEQSPGDIVFLSAADTDLSLITTAQEARLAEHPEAPTLRAANLMQLQHPMSVDLYLERVVRQARVVVVRLLGGRAYWPYGVEQLVAACQASSAALALLPGDDREDAELRGWSGLDAATYDALWSLLGQGGAINARAFVDALGALAARDRGDAQITIRAAETLPENGLLYPLRGDAITGGESDSPIVPLVFYRALVQAGDLAPVQALAEALSARGLSPLPIFLKSLKDAESRAFLAATFAQAPPSVILNFTAFSAAKPGQASDDSPFGVDAPVIQAVLSGGSREAWQEGTQGLGPRDLAMNVVLPEVDGRILSRAVSFKSAGTPSPATECSVVRHQPLPDRIDWVAGLAESWARLRACAPAERGVALVLANYPNKDSRIANGVGLDAPASTTGLLQALLQAGYDIGDAPTAPDALMQLLLSGPTNLDPGRNATTTLHLSASEYAAFFDQLDAGVRTAVKARWGEPAEDPFWNGTGFHLALHRFGNILIGIQPQRGYHLDIEGTYHDPDLVPPHGYLAFYAAIRAQAHAVIHVGKHGNLEWLPGKALALSKGCFPDAVLGPMPQLYPFIVNDPGEGSQAKRRTAAVVIDHLTPPLTRAGLHGDLSALEADVDEYFQAAGLHPARAELLARDIAEKVHDFGLTDDLGLTDGDGDAAVLGKLDGFLCDLKDLQIRDGLHIFGAAPTGPQRRDLLLALARPGFDNQPSYIDELARAAGIDARLLSLDPGQVLAVEGNEGRRTVADQVEALEEQAREILDGTSPAPSAAASTLFAAIETVIAPLIDDSATRELSATLQGLNGRFVPPGPSGAPTRGRLDVLPTGRNFFSVDTRAVPTHAAWRLGWKSASLLVERYAQDHGDWPRRMLLSCWGTANMRSGGEDVAQALALLGVKPQWDTTSGRVTGFDVLPLDVLNRPRVDVTLRVSGFFRDAFPGLMDLFDAAVKAVAARDETAGEDEAQNPLAARVRAEATRLQASGIDPAQAQRQASFRVFGSKPGAYGAGLQALIDSGAWQEPAKLAEAFLSWSSFAYGQRVQGQAAGEALRGQLRDVEAVIHNQDNREHDILDSDDYYQFEGGAFTAIRHLSGQAPAAYHNDHSEPDRLRIRSLSEEMSRIVRGRATNPKWIEGVMRHGYKGAFEMAATLDYLFAFAATTDAVSPDHFQALYDATLAQDHVRDFIAQYNPDALRDMADRYLEAIRRGFWTPRSNTAGAALAGWSSGEEQAWH